MSKGCPCKSAAEVSSSCTYCPKGKNIYASQDQGYQDYQGYQGYQGNQGNQGYQGYGSYPNYPNNGYDQNYGDSGGYQNYNQYPYGGSSEYSNAQGVPEGNKISDSSLSLLKAVAVFCTGCFLTVKMTGVANQL